MGTSLLSGMSSGVATSAKKLLSNQSSFIFNGILIVLTISGESTFSALAFECPCAYPQNIYYGGAFLYAPAISLFLIGILINSTTWKIMHGCCYRSSATSHGCRRSAFYWASVLVQAMVAPLAWLFVAFLNGEYYTCLHAAEVHSCQTNYTSSTNRSKQESLKLKLGESVASEISYGFSVDPECICDLPSLEKKRLQASSQIYGWYLLLISCLVALGLNTILRCLDRFTFRQNYYYNLYRETEETKFQEVAKEKAKALATENWKNFFDKKNRTKLDWDQISVVPLSDFPHFLKSQSLKEKPDPYFSPLHRWNKCPPKSEETKGTAVFVSIDSEEPDEANKNDAKNKGSTLEAKSLLSKTVDL